MTIIAIPSMNDGGLNDYLNPRFGKCSCFTFIELEDMQVKAVKIINNIASSSMGGTGVQAAQIVGENNADIIIITFLGPNATKAVKAFNIKIFEMKKEKISIKEVLELYKAGKLNEITDSNVDSHLGLGRSTIN